VRVGDADGVTVGIGTEIGVGVGVGIELDGARVGAGGGDSSPSVGRVKHPDNVRLSAVIANALNNCTALNYLNETQNGECVVIDAFPVKSILAQFRKFLFLS